MFASPGNVEVRQESTAAPSGDQVLVQTRYSAISAGTELMIYRGEAPNEMPADESLTALSGSLKFPLRYGYAAVGEVIGLGTKAPSDLEGRTVFAFQPHASHFLARPEELVPLPDELPLEAALFLPNMESAVNFLHDGAPLAGDRVVVFGQGVVGLLTTALLARMALSSLLTLDRYPIRREASQSIGAHQALDPSDADGLANVAGRADLAYELTGDPDALPQAIAATGYDGRVVVGSWYGTRRAELDLGGRFHRSRIKLLSSQVSSISPRLTGRWDKDRRLKFALQMIQQMQPSGLITHRYPFERAAEAYALLAEHPEQTIQVILTYKS